MIVAVIGAATCTEAEAHTAAEVGRLLAQNEAVLICGGRGGVMAAACRGAQAAGGLTIGILPGNDRSEANPWVDIAIATGLGEARNGIIIRSADAVIAIAGSYGTLSEIAFALKWRKRLIGLGTWQLPQSGHSDQHIIQAQTAEEAVRLALQIG